METQALRITGISPLLMNNPSSMKPMDETVKKRKIPSPEEEAAAKEYRTADGSLYVNGEGFRSGIITRACKGRKLGKYHATSIVPGALFLLDACCVLTNPTTGDPLVDYEIDTRRAVIQRAGVLRSRPKVSEWETVVQYEYDTDFLTAEVVLELQNLAGKIAGIGDFRPERTGPFGRYSAEFAE